MVADITTKATPGRIFRRFRDTGMYYSILGRIRQIDASDKVKRLLETILLRGCDSLPIKALSWRPRIVYRIIELFILITGLNICNLGLDSSRSRVADPARASHSVPVVIISLG